MFIAPLRLLMALALVALPAQGARATEPLNLAEVGAQTCPTQWAALAAAAPEEVAAYASGPTSPPPIDPDWDWDVAEAMARFVLVTEVSMGTLGALIAVIGSTGTEEVWQAAQEDRDMEYEWTRGKARADLLTCLTEVVREDRGLIFAGAQTIVPEAALEALQEGFEAEFDRSVEAFLCITDISHSVFDLDHRQAGLVAAAQEILVLPLRDCNNRTPQ